WIRPTVAPKKGARLAVGGQDLGPLDVDGLFVTGGGIQWRSFPLPLYNAGKRPGIQGPIDDAFTTPFLCVRGTGKPWNPAVQAWAEANLKRFAYEWHHYFRGDLPVKDDTAVTEEDVKRCNLILFGDPGSNRWIREVLPHLPLRWTREELVIGKDSYPSDGHAPLLIQPSPL